MVQESGQMGGELSRSRRHLEVQLDIARELFFWFLLEHFTLYQRYQDIDVATLHRISVRMQLDGSKDQTNNKQAKHVGSNIC